MAGLNGAGAGAAEAGAGGPPNGLGADTLEVGGCGQNQIIKLFLGNFKSLKYLEQKSILLHLE